MRPRTTPLVHSGQGRLTRFCAVVMLAGFSASLSCCATASDDRHPLEGIWGGSLHLGPEVQGELLIERSSNQPSFTATIAGTSVPVSNDNGRLSFELPNDQGRFRGTIDGDQIVGHWIQSFTPFLGQLFATPVELSPFDSNDEPAATSRAFSGSVEPLADTLTLFLALTYDEGGQQLTGFVRNPERNIGLFPLRFEQLRIEGDQAHFVDADGESLTHARLLDASGAATSELSEVSSLELAIPWGEPFTVELERKRPAGASGRVLGFHPDPDPLYDYRVPVRSADDNDLDWPVADASSQGLDPEILADLVEQIRSTEIDSPRAPYIHSLLVARAGRLVLEEYFYQHDRNLLHDTRSAGKSFASVLTGAAIDRSRSNSFPFERPLEPDSRFVDLFGELSPEPATARGPNAPSLEERSAWRQQMTLSHLLSMSSGLDCDDEDPASPGNEGTMQDQQGDSPVSWRGVGLSLPMVRQPGSQALYCSNSINLAASAVALATKRWLPELFGEWLAAPLGIERYAFNLAPDGDGYMGGGLRLTPRDQLKFGQLMLEGGLWRGQRVLSQDWVARSLEPRASIHQPDDYALGWWRKTLSVQGKNYEVFYASGNGGQLIIGIPELDIVIQFSAGNYRNFPVWSRFLDELVPQYVIPAAD